MAKYPLAYCLESQTDVTPDDVVDMYVTRGVKPTLQCADRSCHQARPATLINDICCDPENPCRKMEAHFKTYPEHEHSPECVFAKYAQHSEYILRHKAKFADIFPDANILKKLKGIEDTSVLPDEYCLEFHPRDFLDKIERKAQEQQRKFGYSSRQAYRMARCAVPQRTQSLALVVRLMEQLHETGVASVLQNALS